MIDMTGAKFMLKPSSRKASPVILPSARAPGQVAVLANSSRRRHGRKNFSQPIDQAAFLIDAEERVGWQQFAHAVEQICAIAAAPATLRPKMITPPG